MYDIYQSCKWTISSIWWHNFTWVFVIELSLWLIEYTRISSVGGKKTTSLQCYSNYFFTIFFITKHIFLLDIKVHVTGMIVKQLCFGLYQKQYIGGFVWGWCWWTRPVFHHLRQQSRGSLPPRHDTARTGATQHTAEDSPQNRQQGE